MPVTYGEVKTLLAQFAGRGGKCSNSKEVDLFTKQVLQYMLYSAAHGNIRKFCFYATQGCITVPFELETPLKIKIENESGNVWNKWMEYHSASSMEGCEPASNVLSEEPNSYPTVNQLPRGGARVGVISTATEAENAFVIIQGKDPAGKVIHTTHEDKQIVGEYLRLQKGIIRYTQVSFGTITAVEKSKTVGYVKMLWVNPHSNTKGFLADYSPLDEKPMYRRFKLNHPYCKNSVKVSVLGRIRLKDNYGDNEIIPFDNLYAISVAGQAVQAQMNNAPDIAAAKDQTMQDLITRESEYKRVQQGQPVDMFKPLSGGSIINIV